MADGRRLRVPSVHQPAIVAIARLDDAGREALVQAVTSVKIEGLTPAQLAEQVASSLSDDRADPGAQAIVDALMSLSVVRAAQGWSRDEIVNSASSSADLDITPAERTVLRRTLDRLMSTPVLWHLAKAYEMGTAYPQSLLNARIFTDIRPVFDDDPSDRPTSVLVVHTLTLRTYNDDGQQSTSYIALDDADLHALSDQIDRARSKGGTIGRMLAELGIATHRLEKA